MHFSSVGDLARLMSVRESNFRLKSTIQQLGQEMTTGRVSDPARHLAGDMVQLTALTARISSNDAYHRAAHELATTANAMQSTLTQIQDTVTGGAANLLSETVLGNASNRQAAANQAAGHLAGVLQSLSVNIGGRFVFSGPAVDKNPVPDPSMFMATIKDMAAAHTDVADAISAIDAWFDGGVGDASYLADAYGGSLGEPAPIAVSADTRAHLRASAADPAIRDTLRGLALAALAGADQYSGDAHAQRALLQAAGNGLLRADVGLVAMRAEVGLTQQTAELASARNAAISTALKIEHSALLEADSYETASKLVQAEAQLEAVYVLTRRLANMTLSRHL